MVSLSAVATVVVVVFLFSSCSSSDVFVAAVGVVRSSSSSSPRFSPLLFFSTSSSAPFRDDAPGSSDAQERPGDSPGEGTGRARGPERGRGGEAAGAGAGPSHSRSRRGGLERRRRRCPGADDAAEVASPFFPCQLKDRRGSKDKAPGSGKGVSQSWVGGGRRGRRTRG